MTIPNSRRPAKFLGSIGYETFLESGDPDFAWVWPNDEWDAIALNYTSGTTGNPRASCSTIAARR